MTSYNQWAWWPVTTFKCSTCSTLRPRRKNLLKKPTKNSKFQKNIQKNQKILQKTFIFLPLDWVPTRLMALFKKSQFQLLVFVTIKMHFKFKRHLCRYLYFFLFENCFNDVSLAREHFHWLSTFQADDWPIRTDFSYCYPRLEKSKATIFLISLFCEISNLKNSESKNILFERVEFFCKWAFENVEISQQPCFQILLSCQMSHVLLF